jgi:hypothetical protein
MSERESAHANKYDQVKQAEESDNVRVYRKIIDMHYDRALVERVRTIDDLRMHHGAVPPEVDDGQDVRLGAAKDRRIIYTRGRR